MSVEPFLVRDTQASVNPSGLSVGSALNRMAPSPPTSFRAPDPSDATVQIDSLTVLPFSTTARVKRIAPASLVQVGERSIVFLGERNRRFDFPVRGETISRPRLSLTTSC